MVNKMSQKCANKDCERIIDMDTEIHCDICGNNFCIEHSMTEDSHICLSDGICKYRDSCCPEEICGQCCEEKKIRLECKHELLYQDYIEQYPARCAQCGKLIIEPIKKRNRDERNRNDF